MILLEEIGHKTQDIDKFRMKLMKTTLLLILTLGIFSLTSCKKDNPQLGDPPSDADATFSYAPSTANPNIIDFTAPNACQNHKLSPARPSVREEPYAVEVYSCAENPPRLHSA